jgi:hypothetical protein
MLPGHATVRPLRRESSDAARPCSRGYAHACDVVSRHQAAIPPVTPPEPEPALGLAARFVPTRGQQTSGLERCWKGRQGRRDKGLDSAALAGLDLTVTGASSRRVEPTPPLSDAPAPETPRRAGALEPLTRVVSAPDLSPRRDVLTAGDDSQPTGLTAVHA